MEFDIIVIFRDDTPVKVVLQSMFVDDIDTHIDNLNNNPLSDGQYDYKIQGVKLSLKQAIDFFEIR